MFIRQCVAHTTRRTIDELLVQKERWMCPITMTVLTNAYDEHCRAR